MNFKLTLKSILKEALSPQKIKDKFYSEIPPNIFYKIVTADPATKIVPNSEDVKPTSTNMDEKLKKIGRYAKLLIKWYLNRELKLEDLPRATEYLNIVYKRKIPVNSKEINNLSDLYGKVEKYIAQETTEFNKVLKTIPNKEYDVLLNGEKWMILTPKTERAACRIGVGTNWCTTWGPESLNPNFKDRSNYFNTYNKKDKLYIFINKEDNDEKYQIHIPSEQFMDKNDRPINFKSLLEINPEILHFFFKSIKSDNPKSYFDYESRIIKYLPNKYIKGWYENVYNIQEQKDIPIINAILTSNTNRFNEITEYQGVSCEDIDIPNNSIELDLGNYTINDVLGDELSWLRSMIDSRNNYYYYDVSEHLNNDYEYINEFTKEKLKEYLNRNHQQPQILFDIINNNTEIIESLLSNITHKISDITQQNYNQATENMQKDFYNVIRKSHYSHNIITINLNLFLKYIIDQHVEDFSDLIDVLSDYCEYNIDMYDYEDELQVYTHVEYPSDDEIKTIFDNSMISKFLTECKYLDLLIKIVDKYFNDGLSYTDEYKTITIKEIKDICENGNISIIYQDKETNKTEKGVVNVKNITNYIQHTKSLF